MKRCVECGVKQDHPIYGVIYFTRDGYCSVCNHKYKDRERPQKKAWFESKIIKEGKYDHLDHNGNKRTKNYDKKQEFYNSAKSGGIIAAGIEYQEYLKKEKDKQKTLEAWR